MAWVLSSEEDEAILTEIERGSDRTCAIVAVAYLESVLTALLRSIFEGERDVIERVIKGYGPLASLSAKIDLVHLLGMIRPEMRKSMSYLKDIRNEFAHSPGKATFKSQRIRDLTQHFPKPASFWKKRLELSVREAIGIIEHAKNPDPKADPRYDQDWVNGVLTHSIYSGRDTPRNRFMIAMKEALLHLYLIRSIVAIHKENVELGRAINLQGSKFWPWPSHGKSARPQPLAPRNEDRKRKKRRRRHRSSQA
jgi:DNA-binding MltR family transcriptional regulator